MADFTQGYLAYILPTMSFEFLANKRPLSSVLESPVFEFIVGPAKKSFKVHSALVAKVSEPLQVMMSSQMLEGIWKSVTMDDIYEDTFIRFCQYLYYGTYLVPESAPSRKGAGPPPATKVGVQTGFISNPTSQLASAASRKLPTVRQPVSAYGF